MAMEGKEFNDTFIVKARQAREEMEKHLHSDEVVEEELKQSIYDDTVTIFGIPVIFRDKEIIENKAVIRMPSDFISRTQDEIASVYFLGSKPQYVFSNGYLNFMLAFNWTDTRMSQGAVYDFARFAKQAIERVGPASRILDEERLQQDGQEMVILQVIAQTIDSVNYNIMFFTSLEERLLLGSLTFDQKYRKRLLPLALEIVKSFAVKKEGTEE